MHRIDENTYLNRAWQSAAAKVPQAGPCWPPCREAFEEFVMVDPVSSGKEVELNLAVLRTLESLANWGLEEMPSAPLSLRERMSAQLRQLRILSHDQKPDSTAQGNKETVDRVSPPQPAERTPANTASDRGADNRPEHSASSEGGYGPIIDRTARIEKLNVLAAEVAQCQKCPKLVQNRTQTVFGVGNPEARICFFGEGPGADEDLSGEPFVGKAGQLLNRIIEACHLKREDVYILNSVKCRPPHNRNPEPNEVEHCWPYAEEQLELIQPQYIVCLGRVAARSLLKTNESIGRLRSRFHSFRNSKVIVTYHPAYLLREPSAKRQVWDDMKMLLQDAGIPV